MSFSSQPPSSGHQSGVGIIPRSLLQVIKVYNFSLALLLFVRGRAPRSGHVGALEQLEISALFPRFMAHVKGKAIRWRRTKDGRLDDCSFIWIAAACCLKGRNVESAKGGQRGN